MIKLESHNVEMEDFTTEIHSTIDNPNNETFTPTVVFISGANKIANTLPPQPYVNGTWTDDDIQKSIDEYILAITVK